MIKRFENRFLMNILVHLLTLHRWRVDFQNVEVVFTGFAYIQQDGLHLHNYRNISILPMHKIKCRCYFTEAIQVLYNLLVVMR